MASLAENKAAIQTISALLRQMSPEDVGGSSAPQNWSSAPAGAVFHRLIAGNDALNVCLFELGPAASLPTHTHPGTVFTAVISGEVQAVTFTRNRHLAGLSVRCERNAVLKPGDVHLTFPVLENIHTMRPHGGKPAIILDLIAPAYSERRPATYMTIRPRAELLQSRLPSSSTLPKEFWASELPWSCKPGTDYSVSLLQDGPLDFETFDRPYNGPPVTLPSEAASSASSAAAAGSGTTRAMAMA